MEIMHPASSGSPAHPSMGDVHRTVPVPNGHWWRRLVAFAGPAYLVSIGYMDPGNWATDIAGGSRFGYRLLWVLLMSNAMAVLLQTLAARLGIVYGRDLAQACRDSYGVFPRWVLFVLCEIAIAACDLAEVLGTAIGINLLFPAIPLVWAVVITGLDVFLLLLIQRWGMRKMEAFILGLISIIGACFVIEIFLSHPSWGGILHGLVPRPLSAVGGENSELYIAISIIGATVMPHNLYLHSALVQSRQVERTGPGIAQACRFNFIDSAVALNLAFFVNAAILIVAAAVFWTRGHAVDEFGEAYQLLGHLLGKVAPAAFGIALICAGQSSTITGTLAGQITMEGFLRLRLRPWLRRLVTRAMAIVPAILVIAYRGQRDTYNLLILSQVILSLQLPFAVVPLVKFTSSRTKMGKYANPRWVKVLAWSVAAIILGLNGRLTYDALRGWQQNLSGSGATIITAVGWGVVLALGALLVWMVFRGDRREAPAGPPPAAEVAAAAGVLGRRFARIGVALEARADDASMLAEAIALAKTHGAALVLMHVVEGVGGQFHGPEAADAESSQDEQYLRDLARHLHDELKIDGIPDVTFALGYGSVARALIQLAQEQRIDLLVVGGHGHGRLTDVVSGETINAVRHGLPIPMLAVRPPKG